MNPYKAVVAPRDSLQEIVPASRYIGIHHCSIEFKSPDPSMLVSTTSLSTSPRSGNDQKIVSKSIDIESSKIKVKMNNVKALPSKRNKELMIREHNKSKETSGSSC